jgi:replication-associated recombination protein RarA
MPEARIILAQVVTYLALAPKSNASYMAIERATDDVQNQKTEQVPQHLRSTAYAGAKDLDHGKGYIYPHDHADSLKKKNIGNQCGPNFSSVELEKNRDHPGKKLNQQYLPKQAKLYTP